ncbi:HprK-related kinase A [Hahella sp. CCB-MM4]|uniref:HprK-related kinase A n=1 Tax=Hahella sp. (strain CCB-MM4) TaxID=1926491 RepID=UPI000B9A6E4A|nr:HprK-related kinase A [Hahella sp. CCB-MM4]OZG73417.1 HprK-related kinase A [Hahella sp. CCB-MM4]
MALQNFCLNLYPFSFNIQTNLKLVRDNLYRLYPGQVSLNSTQVTDYSLSLSKGSGFRRLIKPQARFFCDQKEPFKPLRQEQGYALLEWGMNWTIAANEMQYVIAHSAVLAKDDKAILFPAPPGSGKSTLTAYLAFKGWRLLSDEMALINPDTNIVTPFVRPICLKNRSIDLAKSWFPEGHFSSVAHNTHKGDVVHLSPPEQSWKNNKSNARIVAVVFPNYRAGKELEIYQLNKTQGFMQFAENAFNFGVNGATGFRTLTKVIENAESFEIFYSNLEEVIEFLEQDIIDHA